MNAVDKVDLDGVPSVTPTASVKKLGQPPSLRFSADSHRQSVVFSRVRYARADPPAHHGLYVQGRSRRSSAALVASLGGLDGLVFTAGIGKHGSQIRAGICMRLAWLGIELDEVANAAGAQAH